jgi:cytochrome c oxidase subunit 6b
MIDTGGDNSEDVDEGAPTKEKEIRLSTARLDPRFPSTNQARHCYTAYNEYYKCLQEKDEEAAECKALKHTFRSLCPDEWIARWEELRAEGKWFGKY